MTEDELRLRRRIFASFAATGSPPALTAADAPLARSLHDQHVVVLGDDGQVLMAHPFAAHREGTRVEAAGRTWWGNCAWDGLGIAAALGPEDARITSGGVAVAPGAVVHVAVPAGRWWDDIAFT